MGTVRSRLGLIIFGMALLGLAEVALRLVWTPRSDVTSAWTSIDPFYRSEGMLLYDQAFRGTLRPEPFPARKAPGTYRVFCLGGSTTYGYPLPAEYSWPAFLQRRLRALYPERRVEVINLGGTSYGSARILALLRGVLRYQPDLIIVCLGHNEFVEDSFRSAVAETPGLIGRLRSLALYRAMERLLPKPSSPPRTVVVRPGDDTAGFFFTPKLDGTVYGATPERQREVLEHFRTNLQAMTELSRNEGVNQILVIPPSSLINWPPAPDRSAPAVATAGAAWQSLVARAEALNREGETASALSLYREASSLWDENADVAFREGVLLLAAGRVEEAYSRLVRGRDLDPAPVRMSSPFTDALKTAAAAAAVPLVDAERAFLRLAQTSEEESELMFDHVHPTPRGQSVLSREIWRTMANLAEWAGASPEAVNEIDRTEDRMAEADIPHTASLAYVWGQVFARKGMAGRAEHMFRRAIELEAQQSPYAWMELSRVLVEQGRMDEARTIMEKLTTDFPSFVESYPLLGWLRGKNGDQQGAIDAYRKSFASGNTDRIMILHLVSALAEEGLLGEAVTFLERGMRHYPGDPDLEALRKRIVRESAPAR